MDTLLTIKNLHAKIEGKEILKGINLEIRPGEVHAIMGPNGSGKSTLASVLAGKPGYEVTEGEVWFMGKNLLEMKPEERAREGLFLAFQHPVEIPGVTLVNFLKAAVEELYKHKGLEPPSPAEFLKLLREKKELVEFDAKLENRAVNAGFSGGEKKKNEMLQMAVLEPSLAILDEIDSGLDVDALRQVATGVNKLHNETNSFLVITHYQRLLDYIIPDYVHILYNGRIVKSGDKTLALEVENNGYDWIKNEVTA